MIVISFLIYWRLIKYGSFTKVIYCYKFAESFRGKVSQRKENLYAQSLGQNSI